MIPSNVMRFAFGGAMPAGEIWQCGLWFQSNLGEAAPGNNEDADAALSAMTAGLTQWTALLTALKATWSTGTTHNRNALYCYPDGGPDATAVAIQDVTATAGTNATALPNQTARVVTILTGSAGRSHRGRIYLPGTGEAMSGSTGHFTSTGSSILSAMNTWIEACIAAAVLPGGSGVALRVVSPKLSSAFVATTLRTDNIPDVQRRRANRETGRVYTFQDIGP